MANDPRSDSAMPLEEAEGFEDWLESQREAAATAAKKAAEREQQYDEDRMNAPSSAYQPSSAWPKGGSKGGKSNRDRDEERKQQRKQQQKQTNNRERRSDFKANCQQFKKKKATSETDTYKNTTTRKKKYDRVCFLHTTRAQ